MASAALLPYSRSVYLSLAPAPRPDQEAWGLIELAKGLAYLCLQQVRSAKKPVIDGVQPAMSNSGQAADHGSQALIFISSLGRRVPREIPTSGEGPVSRQGERLQTASSY